MMIERKYLAEVRAKAGDADPLFEGEVDCRGAWPEDSNWGGGVFACFKGSGGFSFLFAELRPLYGVDMALEARSCEQVGLENRC